MLLACLSVKARWVGPEEVVGTIYLHQPDTYMTTGQKAGVVGLHRTEPRADTYTDTRRKRDGDLICSKGKRQNYGVVR